MRKDKREIDYADVHFKETRKANELLVLPMEKSLHNFSVVNLFLSVFKAIHAIQCYISFFG